jgi:hypothetical protein
MLRPSHFVTCVVTEFSFENPGKRFSKSCRLGAQLELRFSTFPPENCLKFKRPQRCPRMRDLFLLHERMGGDGSCRNQVVPWLLKKRLAAYRNQASACFHLEWTSFAS